MKKTIILNENSFNKIKRLIIQEAIKSAPVFGRNDDFTAPLKQLAKVANLHVDRYKDYELEEAYNDWKNTGYDKNSDEYLIYNSKFKHFMFGEGGLLSHISYTAERTTYEDKKTGTIKAVPLHKVILDTEWADGIVNVPNWKYSNNNTNAGCAQKQCFYTTVLKIFQNPVIWNDFFFNPIFENARKTYNDIRMKIMEAFKFNKEAYSAIMPMKEFRELNMFINEVNKDTMKVEKGLNCKPELFYDPSFGTNNNFNFQDDEEM